MERLGLDPQRKLGRSAVERRMRECGLDPSTLPGQGWSRSNGDSPRYRKALSEILVAGRLITSTAQLKERLVQEGVLEWRCAVCDLNTWLSRPLVLQLDHINGDRRDNRRENLRFLCPNCHSQTNTFAGKNVGRGYSPGR
ncbi:MAG: HNH endonuclease [Actinobacteria bacterium]|nr:HNH endonuclease [Actinomycetota bacterium]